MRQKLIRYLQSQGLGSAKMCKAWLKEGLIEVNGNRVFDPLLMIEPTKVTDVTLAGEKILTIPVPFFYLALNKPVDYEVTHRPRLHPAVYDLLPTSIQNLNTAAVGRLDVATCGLLLFTNDGDFNHRLTSPKKEIEKEYRVTLKHKGAPDVAKRLLAGVMLKDAKDPVYAKAARSLDEYTLMLTITSGKYHQVRRMVAAAGNRVLSLQRTRIGALTLTPDLPEGAWRFIRAHEVLPEVYP